MNEVGTQRRAQDNAAKWEAITAIGVKERDVDHNEDNNNQVDKQASKRVQILLARNELIEGEVREAADRRAGRSINVVYIDSCSHKKSEQEPRRRHCCHE